VALNFHLQNHVRFFVRPYGAAVCVYLNVGGGGCRICEALRVLNTNVGALAKLGHRISSADLNADLADGADIADI
jgi:hypothetical protein